MKKIKNMPEKFDFRKVEDQERFDKLPKEEQESLTFKSVLSILKI